LFEEANLDEHLELRDAQENTSNLQQIEATEAKRTLCVWQAPNGDETTQAQLLKDKILDWGDKTKKISHSEARTAVKQTVGRTIRYPLAATAMNKKECKDVQKVFKRETLGKMGVVRTALNEVVLSPTEFGGMGQLCVYENQTIDHVNTLLQRGHSESITGHLIRTSLEYLSLEAGISGDPMSLPLHHITWISDKTWINTTIKAMEDLSISIETNMTGIEKWTKHDTFIMEDTTHRITGKDIAIFNKVRMYLKVATTSDICSADGKCIDKNKLMAEPEVTCPNPSRSAYNWPNIPKLTKAVKKIWTETICLMDNITNNDRQVRGQLNRGKNNAKPHTQWCYNKDNDEIYKREGEGWKKWKRTGHLGRTQRNTRRYIQSQQLGIPAENSALLSIKSVGTMIIITSIGDYEREQELYMTV